MQKEASDTPRYVIYDMPEDIPLGAFVTLRRMSKQEIDGEDTVVYEYLGHE
jgi:hypothetical protein